MDFKETLSTVSKKPTPTKSSTPASSPPATTRFPPRKTTTTTTPEPSTQQHYKPLSTSLVKPVQSAPPNKFTSSKLPFDQETSQQQVASPSVLVPQYTSIKPFPSKLSTPSTTLDTSTTVKYSAHYTTPYPTVPPKQTTHHVKPQSSGAMTKPGGISVKKPILSTQSTSKNTTPATTSQTTVSSENITESTGITTGTSFMYTTQKTAITKKTTTAPTITTYKASTTTPLILNTGTKQPIINNFSQRTTTISPHKPTTYRPSTARPQPEKYTLNQRPSGIPTIVHYLPMHSMSPSHAPVSPTTTANTPLESINQIQQQSTKLTTQQQTTKPTITTTLTTTNDNSVTSTIFEESSTIIPTTDKEFQEITAQRFPSTATITTKNHYTVIDSVKSSLTTTKPVNNTQTITTTYGTTIPYSETNASAAPLMAAHSALPMHTSADQDSGNTVSVVTIFEDTTRPMEITAGKIRPNTNTFSTDKFIQTTASTDQLESFTTATTSTSTTITKPSMRPSTIMVPISTKPPYRNNITISTVKSQQKPSSTKPTIINRRTTTTTSPPPRRGTVSYTPLPQVYKSTTPSYRQPVKTTAAASIQTTSRPSVVTVEQRRPASTTTMSTTTKPIAQSTTAAVTIATTITTESTTTTKPTESISHLTKLPLEQLPLKLIENLKDSNKPTIYEMPSTVDIDNYSTLINQDSTTEASTAETTDFTAATTLTTFPAKTMIVNNSEPFSVNHSSLEKNNSRLPPSEALTLTQTTSYTTLPSTVEYSTIDTETTTTEPITTYKDQILEEGINAVTNLLLDGEQKKEFLLNMTRPLGLFNNTFLTTTEDEQMVTDENTSTTELVPQSEEKSETRVDEVELTEDYEQTGELISEMSTTQREEIDNSDKEFLKISTQIPVHNQVKKHIQSEVKHKESEETKFGDKKTNENLTIITSDQEIKIRHKEKINETKNANKSSVKITELQEKIVTEEESKKTVHTKPISQENMKKPTQQEIKKQPNDEIKRPILNKVKPSNPKPIQEKVNNSTRDKLKEATEDEGDDPKIPVKLEIKGQTDNDTKKSHIVPTKESKLNPDIVDEVIITTK